MVDALTRRGDEGRRVAAITSGRCRATFDPKISEWGNPIEQTSMTFRLMRKEYTQGSETSQYLEENKPIRISSVAASEREQAQTFRRKAGRVVGRYIRFLLSGQSYKMFC